MRPGSELDDLGPTAARRLLLAPCVPGGQIPQISRSGIKRKRPLSHYMLRKRYSYFVISIRPRSITRYNAVQTHTRAVINRLTLEQALTATKALEDAVLKAVTLEPELIDLGITVLNQHITAIKPTPEMQKALEADYREKLQKQADQAIYDRRAAAVEEERNIQEREINTEIEIENRRKELVDTQARNNPILAEAEAQAAEMQLNPYAEMPPQALVGLAFKEWAGNAGQIGNLNITSDLLGQVVAWMNTGDKEAA